MCIMQMLRLAENDLEEQAVSFVPAEASTQLAEIALVCSQKAAMWLETGILDRVASVAAELEDYETSKHGRNPFVSEEVIKDMGKIGVDTIKVATIMPHATRPCLTQVRTLGNSDQLLCLLSGGLLLFIGPWCYMKMHAPVLCHHIVCACVTTSSDA